MAVNTEANCNKSLLVMMPSGIELMVSYHVWIGFCPYSVLIMITAVVYPTAGQKMAITRVAVTAVLLVLYWRTHHAEAQGG